MKAMKRAAKLEFEKDEAIKRKSMANQGGGRSGGMQKQ